MAVRNNLRAWREQAKMSREQLAEKLNTSSVSVFRIEKGKQHPRPELLEKIAKFFEKTPAQFFVDPFVLAESVEQRRIEQQISVVSLDQVNKPAMVYFGGPSEGRRSTKSLVDYRPPAGSIGVLVHGRSMEPAFRQGDLVIIDPKVKPVAEDFVIAQDEHGEKVLRQFHDKGPDGSRERLFELVALNPAYPNWRSDKRQIEILGTMIEHRTYRHQHSDTASVR